MTKKLKKQTLGIMGVGVTATIGASIGDKLGGTAGGHLGQSMSRVSGQLPTIGTLAGSGAILRATNDLIPKKRR